MIIETDMHITGAQIGASGRPHAMVKADGLIAAITDPLLDDLGFEPGDDLSGLPFVSLWAHDIRPMVREALRQAIERKCSAELDLDLEYLQGVPQPCKVTLLPVEEGRHVMVVLEDSARPA